MTQNDKFEIAGIIIGRLLKGLIAIAVLCWIGISIGNGVKAMPTPVKPVPAVHHVKAKAHKHHKSHHVVKVAKSNNRKPVVHTACQLDKMIKG